MIDVKDLTPSGVSWHLRQYYDPTEDYEAYEIEHEGQLIELKPGQLRQLKAALETCLLG